MESVSPDTTKTERPPRQQAFRAVLIILTGQSLLALLLAVFSLRWQPILVTFAGLALAGAAAFVHLRLTRQPRAQAWLLLAAVWISLNLFQLFIAGFWLLLALTLVLATIALASLLFERSESSTPMLAGLVAGVPIILVQFLLRPGFRLSLPPIFAGLVPYLFALVAAALIYFLLRQFSFLSLRQKLIVSYLFLSLVPLAGIWYVYDVAFRRALTESATQSLSAVASQTADTIDAFIETNLNAIAAQSTLPAFEQLLDTAPDDPGFERLLAEANLQIYNLQELNGPEADEDSYLLFYSLINREGIVLLDTSVPYGNDNPEIGTNLSNDAIFLNTALIGLPYASPIRAPTAMSSAAIFFAHRITNAQNRPIGILMSAYNARFLQDLLTANEGLAGDGSYGVLFDENQIFLAHALRPDLVFQSVMPLRPTLLSELIASGRLPEGLGAMSSIEFPELNERLANAARQPFFSIQDRTTTGVATQVATSRLTNYAWLVAFFQPQQIYLQPVNAQTANILVLAGLVAAAAVAIAIFASNQLAGPILRVTESAEKVAAGDLMAEARVDVHDEVGTLANTFNSMTRQLRETLTGLEALVAERTSRLEATNEIGRVASSILNRDELIANIVNLITDKFGYYYSAIFLVDEEGRWANLAEATGEAGILLKARGHRLEVGGRSMVGSAIATRTARIALDAGEEAVRFDNPLLPETRSEIALPLIVGEQVLGALDVQSTQRAAFDDQDLATLQTLANQIAIAIENANLFAWTERSAVRQRIMNTFSHRLQRAPDVQEILSTTVSELAQLLEASEVTIQMAPEEALKKPTNGSS